MTDKIYLITYVHIITENHDNYDNFSLYFAGLASTQEEAKKIAKSCSYNLKNGTIIPKILSYDKKMNLIDMMYDASDKFDKILAQMKEMHERLNTQKNKKK